MDDLTVNLTVRCSMADLEIIDRLRANRSRARSCDRSSGRQRAMCVTVSRAGIPQIAREMGIGEENADLLEAVAVRRGLWKIEEDAE